MTVSLYSYSLVPHCSFFPILSHWSEAGLPVVWTSEMFASLGGSLKKWSRTGTPTYCWDWIQLIHPTGPLGQRRWHHIHQNQNVPLDIPSDGLSFTPAFLFHPLLGSAFTLGTFRKNLIVGFACASWKHFKCPFTLPQVQNQGCCLLFPSAGLRLVLDLNLFYGHFSSSSKTQRMEAI